MPLETLWECICRLSGEDGTNEVPLDDAVARSAVPHNVAVVEVRRMIEDGLIEGDERTVKLTERGRRSCSDIYVAKGVDNRNIAPE